MRNSVTAVALDATASWMKLRAMHTTHATRKQRNATSIIWHSVPTSEDVLVFLSLIPQPLNFKFLVLLCWGSADDNLGPTFCLDWMQIHCYLISLLDCISHFFSCQVLRIELNSNVLVFQWGGVGRTILWQTCLHPTSRCSPKNHKYWNKLLPFGHVTLEQKVKWKQHVCNSLNMTQSR